MKKLFFLIFLVGCSTSTSKNSILKVKDVKIYHNNECQQVYTEISKISKNSEIIYEVVEIQERECI